MTQHAFVATDGSPAAGRAVDMAGDIAAKFQVPLTIGHVLHFGRDAEEMARMAEVEHLVDTVRRDPSFEFAMVPDTVPGVFEELRGGRAGPRAIARIGEEILARAAERATARGAREVSTRSANGDTADAILDMAGDVGADLVVVGHRGLGRLRTALLGSVAHKIVQHAECTVVSVR